MRPGRFSHSRQRPDILWILYAVECNQAATYPGGTLHVFEQFVQGQLGQRPHAKRNTLVVPLGSHLLFEICRIHDFDDHPGRPGKFDQFGLFWPLAPVADPQTIEAAAAGTQCLADRMKSTQPDR